MIEPAERMQGMAAHFFARLNRQIAAMTADGMDVIRLDEGAPDLPPPAHIIEALARAAAKPDRHSYQPHRGPASLRQAWAKMYARCHGVQIDPEREVLPILGSKEGIVHLPLAFLNPGQVVLVPDPGYVTYWRGAMLAGGRVETFALRPENDYIPDFEAIPKEALKDARILWLNYPNNPTAAVASKEFFMQAVDFARRNNLLLCHDAAYTQVTFDGQRAASILEAPGAKDTAVEFNTLSKSHNMAGWRVGALVGNPEVIELFHRLKTNLDSGHFLPIMEAAAVALTGDQTWIEERNLIYQERRDVLLSALRSLGWEVKTPHASLYVWSPVPPGWDCEDFAEQALQQAQVSLTPGTVFGTGGAGFVRISITTPRQRIEQAGERLIQWMGGRQ
jgi:LL-diaminopimelate aminotransferase